MPIFKELKEYLMGLFKNKVKTPISKERKEYLMEVFKRSSRIFGKIATRSEYPGVPKEQQLSIDLGNKKIFGIKNRILHWIESKFKYFFKRYNLFPEVGTEERTIPGTNTKVKYFTPDEQIEHALYIGEENGDLKLYTLEGKLYDTTNETSKGKEGYVAYVLTLDGRLVTHAHVNTRTEEYAYRHSMLAGGEPVICSGLLQVINGKITHIDNNSGHYKPEAANLYKVVEKFKGLFSKNAKVVCYGYFYRLLQQIPLIRKIPTKKEESVENFLERMEKKGKDKLTEYEKYFAKVKEHNEQYRQKLFLTSYKSPTLKFLKELDEDFKVKKITIEHSIRKIIGAGYGHKPKIDIIYDQKEILGINITFSCEDDSNRFIKLLKGKNFTYELKDKLTIFIDGKQASKFIQNTLQIKIDSIEQLSIAPLRNNVKQVADKIW
ncbi:hypothetical protein [Wolbachia endosymbiont (group E) of Neria commutata]|uniref:hypothetical protein n=1 Tax=Wolbachia endosymbiont (group E) of Neria commutata TaxID=3066149 RepID=UPI0031329A85